MTGNDTLASVLGVTSVVGVAAAFVVVSVAVAVAVIASNAAPVVAAVDVSVDDVAVGVAVDVGGRSESDADKSEMESLNGAGVCGRDGVSEFVDAAGL